eukprot:TRINITY_DN56577_c0_g1_i1.p2 TRINITY_DN56577_c0_g1~~TRINITY_DN56577_c0_g1_i1.p2  ORF type:complete len:549 (+),score=221.31 TRINITY_DN56577_c0_g1_i1:109-1755(+)
MGSPPGAEPQSEEQDPPPPDPDSEPEPGVEVPAADGKGSVRLQLAWAGEPLSGTADSVDAQTPPGARQRRVLTVQRRRQDADGWSRPRRVRRLRFDSANGVLQMLHAFGGSLLLPIPHEARARALSGVVRLAVAAGVQHNLPASGDEETALLPCSRPERIAARARQAQLLRCKLPSPMDIGAAASEDERQELIERRRWLLQQIALLEESNAAEQREAQEEREAVWEQARAKQLQREKSFSRGNCISDRDATQRLHEAKQRRWQQARSHAEDWQARAELAAARQAVMSEMRLERAQQLSERREELLRRHRRERRKQEQQLRRRGGDVERRLAFIREVREQRWDELRSSWAQRSAELDARLESRSEALSSGSAGAAAPSPARDRSAPAEERRRKLLESWLGKEQHADDCRRARELALADAARVARERNCERESRVQTAQGDLLGRRREGWERKAEQRAERYQLLQERQREKERALAAARLAHEAMLEEKKRVARARRDGSDGAAESDMLVRAAKRSLRAECLQRLMSPLAATPPRASSLRASTPAATAPQ